MTARSSLVGDLDLDVTLDAPIGAMTWYGIGGRADMLVSPRSAEALELFIRRCQSEEMPVRVLGGGANLLVDDAGVDGVVIRLDHEHFRSTAFNAVGDVTAARVAAGVDLFRLVQDMSRRGLAGLEMMAGIPGTVGGAVRMNAGGSWGAFSDALDTITAVDFDGELRSWKAADLYFQYRRSDLPPCIVTEVILTLHEADPVEVRDKVKQIFQHKRASQPMADHSAGCAFRNPEGTTQSAGRLIDETGLKGHSIGGAVVSDQHANFIVAQPGASSTDIRKLIDDVQARVAAVHGITLEPEVVIWQRGVRP
ncbi:MAG: UDP-N-acetylmuramate dehydrogenase [Phycisphaerales bacterium]|nr:UDP-N-acetylmuramate dehydrogenase [Phycisphaerales bacterium]